MTRQGYDDVMVETIDEQIVEDLLSVVNNGNMVVLYNDNVNDFEWVVKSLVDICEMSEEEAFNKTLEAHNKGYTDVYNNDDIEACADVCNKLSKRGLIVELA